MLAVITNISCWGGLRPPCGMTICHLTHFLLGSFVATGHHEFFFFFFFNVHTYLLHSLTLMPKGKLKSSSLQVNLSDYFGI